MAQSMIIILCQKKQYRANNIVYLARLIESYLHRKIVQAGNASRNHNLLSDGTEPCGENNFGKIENALGRCLKKRMPNIWGKF